MQKLEIMFSIDLVKQNQSWRTSTAAREWDRFLALFTQKNPTCPRHPDLVLTKEWKKNDNNQWEGTLKCPDENEPFGYVWPTVQPLYEWVGNAENELLEEQKSVNKEILLQRHAQLDEICEYFLSGKTGIPTTSKQEEINTDSLYKKEDSWKNWMDYEDFHSGAEEKSLDQAVHYRIQLIQKGHLRDQYWDEFHKLSHEHLDQWIPWLERHTWDILDHEGMPVPKRLEQIQKESPGISMEALEKWFRWSEASRDYLMILSKEQEFQSELQSEKDRENRIIENFYFVFPIKIGGEEEEPMITGITRVSPATGGFLSLSVNDDSDSDSNNEIENTQEDILDIGTMTPQEEADPGNNERAEEERVREEENTESNEENAEQGWKISTNENVESQDAGEISEDINEFVNNEQESGNSNVNNE